MYIEETSGYYIGTEQHVRRAKFLLLVQAKDDINNVRAIVRKVALGQFGHWMMGSCYVKGERIGISGSYGSDGLPCTVSQSVFDEAVPLPKYLYDAWNKGGGWNSCGREAIAMRKWALDNIKALYNVRSNCNV